MGSSLLLLVGCRKDAPTVVVIADSADDLILFRLDKSARNLAVEDAADEGIQPGDEIAIHRRRCMGLPIPLSSVRKTDAGFVLSHSRPRFGCRCGTLRPSRRQIRSTRFWYTTQPAACSNAVIRRWPYRPAPAGPCEGGWSRCDPDKESVSGLPPLWR